MFEKYIKYDWNRQLGVSTVLVGFFTNHSSTEKATFNLDFIDQVGSCTKAFWTLPVLSFRGMEQVYLGGSKQLKNPVGFKSKQRIFWIKMCPKCYGFKLFNRQIELEQHLPDSLWQMWVFNLKICAWTCKLLFHNKDQQTSVLWALAHKMGMRRKLASWRLFRRLQGSPFCCSSWVLNDHRGLKLDYYILLEGFLVWNVALFTAVLKQFIIFVYFCLLFILKPS